MKRIAINGFGRIGSALFSLAHNDPEIKVVAINDLMDLKSAEYMLRYDTVRGKFKAKIEIDEKEGVMIVDNRKIKWLSEPDPKNLSWGDADIDVVVDCTGKFTEYEKAKLHLESGAKKVIVSAPLKGDAPKGYDEGTVLVGVNDEKAKELKLTSNASCTTNAVGIPIAILDSEIGVEKAVLNTIHGYTSSQSTVDSISKKKDSRIGRAAALNIIPTTTGAAVATTKAVENLKGKFDGMALRVPVVNGSIADITFISKRDTSVSEVNEILREYSQKRGYIDLFGVTEEPIVSSDIVGNTCASLVDLSLTRVVDGNLVKLLSWYDNEMGYANTLVRHIKLL